MITHYTLYTYTSVCSHNKETLATYVVFAQKPTLLRYTDIGVHWYMDTNDGWKVKATSDTSLWDKFAITGFVTAQPSYCRSK